jgi:hypothetical protein
MREEALLQGPVKGTTAFAVEFQRHGPRAGNPSLRDLDLRTRLFRYPCSYLVYGSSFDALPAEMKSHLWRHLAQILSGRDQGEIYRDMPSKTGPPCSKSSAKPSRNLRHGFSDGPPADSKRSRCTLTPGIIATRRADQSGRSGDAPGWQKWDS